MEYCNFIWTGYSLNRWKWLKAIASDCVCRTACLFFQVVFIGRVFAFPVTNFLPLNSIQCSFRSSLTTCSWYWTLRSPNNSYESLTVVSSHRFPMYNISNLFWSGGLFLQNGKLYFLSSNFTFLRMLQVLLCLALWIFLLVLAMVLIMVSCCRSWCWLWFSID